ncbi:MAG: hypothetical protein VXW50_07950, partial [Pseudomonadota bacterium]|nr:hypothetical protein [Pseudomonadota bacterium]
MPSVSATPGVVVGSYTDRANAQSAAENARRALGAISSEIEIHIVSQGANARVVVVPAVAAQTRSLLS